MIEGLWVTDPEQIKASIWNFFAKKFDENMPDKPKLINPNFAKLDCSDCELLDKPFSIEEVEFAVKSCGNDKAPGPDGFTFKFIKEFWQDLKDDIFAFVKKFENTGRFNKGCNSSFISLIPKCNDPLSIKDYRPVNLVGCMYKIISKILSCRLKKVIAKVVGPEQSAYIEGRSILDGPLVLNEVIAWTKKIKKKLLVFKVDFEKAFDSLNWNFLDSIMEQMNFSLRWRQWIRGCLTSGRASILVRQGDPMASFLFVIAMEGLSISIREACNQHLYYGISLPNNGPYLSHLMYADDVTFVGEWSETNLINLNRILRCFFIASGLKVNLNKSKVFGVGVDNVDLNRLASILSCEPASLPCTYLGLPPGANMRISRFWKPIIDKFHSRLSVWKAKLLSFGGRLTLAKSVLSSLPLYFFSLFKAPMKVIHELEAIRRKFIWGGCGNVKKINWIAWDVLIRPKHMGGLGIGCLKEMNIALLSKWLWRLKIQQKSFWFSCISSIHKIQHIDGKPLALKSIHGTWLPITEIEKDLTGWNISLKNLFTRKVGNGDNTHFWKDIWYSDIALKEAFPRLYSIEANKNCLIVDRLFGSHGNCWNWKRNIKEGVESNELVRLNNSMIDYPLTDKPDTWVWNHSNSGCFSVQSLRAIIAKERWNGDTFKFKWCRTVPLKINCFVWRLFRNRIPLAVNLASRGVKLDSVICPFC